MTDQHEGEHRWIPRVLDWEDVDGTRCSINFCDAQMDDEEMSRRLNAADRLSAEDARRGANIQSRVKNSIGYDFANTLRAYADAREGK